MKTIRILFFTLFAFCGGAALAQSSLWGKDNQACWYAGVQGGLSYATSTFSSFANGQTHHGWNSGLYAGYRWNSFLSAEVHATLGSNKMGIQSCCQPNGYWLWDDGLRYYSSPGDGYGYRYDKLYGKLSYQRYSVSLHANLLALLSSLRDSKWSISIAPEVGALHSESSLYLSETGEQVKEHGDRWQMTLGGQLTAAYRLTKQLQMALYTGMHWVAGDKLDGLPDDEHDNNYIWESGVRIGWYFVK